MYFRMHTDMLMSLLPIALLSVEKWQAACSSQANFILLSALWPNGHEFLTIVSQIAIQCRMCYSLGGTSAYHGIHAPHFHFSLPFSELVR